MAVFENNNKRYIIKGSWWWPQSSLRPIDKWMNVSKSTWLSEIRKSFSSFQVMPSDFFRNFYYPDTLVIPVKTTDSNGRSTLFATITLRKAILFNLSRHTIQSFSEQYFVTWCPLSTYNLLPKNASRSRYRGIYLLFLTKLCFA